MLLRSHQLGAYERSQRTARTGACQSSLASVFALRLLFPYGLSVVRRRVGQSLSDDALHGAGCALRIVYAQPDPIGIAEIKFGQVAVKMLLAAMLVSAGHATFENREITFDGIGMDQALAVMANVLIGLM